MTYPMLEGLRVLELGEWVSAPYCGKLLADMGAEVIKIERSPAGDPIRGYGPYPNDEPHYERSGMFLYLNSNKRGITLNLETPTGKELLAGLLAGSDVFVHNLHPLEMDRLEMDYSGSRRDHGSLVVASITPFGLTGPYRNYKAYDINLAAGGGICEGLGEPDREPLTFGTPQVGYFAGAAAASSIVIALLGRNLAHDPSTDGAQDSRSPDNQNDGQHIDIAEIEAMAGLYTGPEALMAVYQWRATKRTGHHALDFPYPNCILRCKDGYVFVGSPEGRQWRTLLELMGQPGMGPRPQVCQPHRDEQPIRRRNRRLPRGVAGRLHQGRTFGTGLGASGTTGAGAWLRRSPSRPQPFRPIRIHPAGRHRTGRFSRAALPAAGPGSGPGNASPNAGRT